MRFLLYLSISMLATASLHAEKKVVSPTTTASNDQVDISATITLDEEDIARKIGVDPGKGVALLEVRVAPKTDKPIQISPDDFVLLAYDDGQRSKPFDPAELAGQGALVVKTSPDGKVSRTSGFGGFGPFGGGSSPGGAKKPDTVTSNMDAANEGSKKLEAQLKAKQLLLKETADPVEGFLYFPLEGKHRLKNLVVLYHGDGGKLKLVFQH
ncbi:MAG: hypothetical protein JOY62_13870 [Acidobacteriaceae bacterium]|nr:hypothetical protein [Acidobacteriaceae bacterium]MBV9781050.1 hypothetical protein [Acidobacteriaceae bacterium]